MLTVTETAAAIRTALKAAGIPARAVSVRRRPGGSSINVDVIDASVGLAKVKAIAKRFEEVRRCQTSGEILSGGNLFIFVGWAHGALDAIRAEVQSKWIEGAREQRIEGFVVYRDHKGAFAIARETLTTSADLSLGNGWAWDEAAIQRQLAEQLAEKRAAA